MFQLSSQSSSRNGGGGRGGGGGVGAGDVVDGGRGREGDVHRPLPR